MKVDVYNKDEIQSSFKIMYFMNALFDFGAGSETFNVNGVELTFNHRSNYQNGSYVELYNKSRRILGCTEIDRGKHPMSSKLNDVYFILSCSKTLNTEFTIFDPAFLPADFESTKFKPMSTNIDVLEAERFLYEVNIGSTGLYEFLFGSLVLSNISTFEYDAFYSFSTTTQQFTFTDLWNVMVNHFSTKTRYRNLVQKVQDMDEIK